MTERVKFVDEMFEADPELLRAVKALADEINEIPAAKKKDHVT